MPHDIHASEAAEVLSEIASYLEFKSENPFKVRAFENASRVLKGQATSINELRSTGALEEMKGIGKGILEKLDELIKHGKSLYLEELRTGTPAGLGDMLQIPGFGPKKARLLYDKLKIETIEDLAKACEEGKLNDLKGFGKKTTDNILRGIAFQKDHSQRYLYSDVIEEAKIIENAVAKMKDVEEISLGGSLRRHLETIKDVDLVAATKHPEKLIKAFVSLPQVKDITGQGETKGSVVLKSGLRVDLRCVSPAEFPFALHHFTGSKEHNTALRTRAKAMGLKMNEYGIFKDDKILPCKNEHEIFKRLKLHYIPPELRENFGEIEEAEEKDLDDLVEPTDLQGVFHVHTDYSDGLNTLDEMVNAAIERKLKYIGISDHSQTAVYANGLKADRIKKQHDEIVRLREEHPEIAIFHGIESDILKDGSLDYPDKILEKFDFIVASIHGRFKMSEKEMTERVIQAVKNPYCTMLGHPSGRLLLKREPFAINIDAVVEAAIEADKIVEINAQPSRCDLDWRFGRRASRKGLLTSINPDAHQTSGIDLMYFGVGIARKAGFKKDRVFNTWSLPKVTKYLAKHKAA